MPGLGQIALGTAPIFGGAMLAVAAGQFKGPDFRAVLKQDIDLLDRLPPDTPERAELRHTIEERIEDMVAATDRSRALRAAAASYQGHWRDVVLFICAVLFTVVWWNISHSRTNWLPMFIVLILLCVLTAVYAMRGVLRAVATLNRSRRRNRQHAAR